MTTKRDLNLLAGLVSISQNNRLIYVLFIHHAYEIHAQLQKKD